MSEALVTAANYGQGPATSTYRHRWSLLQTFGFVCLAAAALFNMLDLVGDKVGNQLDLQVIIKLFICSGCGLFGLYGALNWAKVPKVLLSFPVILLFLIGIMFLASVPLSVDRRSTFVSASLFWTMLLAVVSAMHCLGRERTLTAIATGMFLFVILSWLAYYLVPSKGVFMESLAGGEFQRRMGGLSHPNTLGIFSGLLSALLISAGIQRRIPWRWILVPLLLTIGAMIMSLSRTSMGALLLSTLIVNRGMFRRKDIFVAATGAAAVLILVFFVFSLNKDLTLYTNDFLERFSKSGDVDELTTGTGRAEIWTFAIEKIGEAPLLGHGLATSKKVMIDYSGYTHNFWLNLFYSCGIPCGLLGIALTANLLLRAFRRPQPLVDGAMIFMLLNGITENIAFSPVPSGPTMMLILLTAWPFFAPSKRSRWQEDEILQAAEEKRNSGLVMSSTSDESAGEHER